MNKIYSYLGKTLTVAAQLAFTAACQAPDGSINLNLGGALASSQSMPQITFDFPSNNSYLSIGNLNATVVSGTCYPSGQYVVLSGTVSGSALCANGAWFGALDFSNVPDSNSIQVEAKIMDVGGQFVASTINFLKKNTQTPKPLYVNTTVAPGYYGLGAVIPIQVVFSDVVNVMGSPSISLNTSGGAQVAYAYGSGTNTLVFNYMVQAGDSASPLQYVSTASFQLNGSSIANPVGTTASIVLPTLTSGGSLGLGTPVTVDAVTPTLTGLSNSSVVTNSVLWNWGCSKSNCSYRYIVDTNPNTVPTGNFGYTSSVTQASGTGIYYLHVQAKDLAGNVSNVGHYFATLDNSGAVVTGLTNDAVSRQTKTWNWGCSKSTCTYSYVIDTAPDTIPPATFGPATSASQTTGTGTYYIHVRALDGAGNLSPTVTVSAILDNSNPTVTGLSNDPIATKGKTWTWGCSKASCTYRFLIDNTATSSPATAFSNKTTVTQQGGDAVFYIHVQAMDIFGNVSPVVHASAILDNTAPTVTGLTNDAVTTNNKIWNWGCNESTCTYSFAVDQTYTGLPTSSFASTTTTNFNSGYGTYYLHVQAKDQAGNLSPIVTVSAFVDNVPPSVTGLVDDSTTALSKTWTWGCSKASCTYVYSIDTNATIASITGTFGATTTATQNTGTGNYYLHVQAKDNSGNLSTIVNALAILDNTPPTVTGLSNDSNLTKSKTWTWGCSKATCNYRYSIDTSSGGTPSGAYSVTSTATQSSGTGTYYIHVQAQDPLGNTSTVYTASVPLDNTPPTVIGLSNDAVAKRSKSWSWSCNKLPCTYSYLIDLVSNSAPPQNPSDFAAANTATQSTGTGTYYIHVVARDAIGNISATPVHVSAVLDNTPPPVPSAVTLTAPCVNPGNSSNPTVTVGPMTTGDSAALFFDSACTTAVPGATGVASGATISFTLGTALSTGSYTFYANATDPLGNVSNCSTVFAPYTLSSIPVFSQYSFNVRAGSTVTLNAGGGTPPYTYTVTSGPGSMSGNVFTAPAATYGYSTVQLTDSLGQTATTTVSMVDNPKLWLDASGMTCIYDGNKVSAWNDLSATPKNFTQATAANQPTYKTNVLNNKPVVRFSNTSGTFLTNTGSLDLRAGTSGFIVADITDWTVKDANALLVKDTTDIGLVAYGSPPSLSLRRISAWGNNGVNIAGERTPGPVAASGTRTGFHVLFYTFDGNIGRVYRDLGSKTSGIATALGAGMSNQGTAAMANAYIGKDPSSTGGGTLTGDIAEIIVLPSVVNAATMTSIKDYLVAKYNLSLNKFNYGFSIKSTVGSYTYTVPTVNPPVNYVAAHAFGAGAAGSGSFTGAGGGAGGYIMGIFPTSTATSFSGVIGGNGGSCNNCGASSGGPSSITYTGGPTLYACGGYGVNNGTTAGGTYCYCPAGLTCACGSATNCTAASSLPVSIIGANGGGGGGAGGKGGGGGGGAGGYGGGGNGGWGGGNPTGGGGGLGSGNATAGNGADGNAGSQGGAGAIGIANLDGSGNPYNPPDSFRGGGFIAPSASSELGAIEGGAGGGGAGGGPWGGQNGGMGGFPGGGGGGVGQYNSSGGAGAPGVVIFEYRTWE